MRNYLLLPFLLISGLLAGQAGAALNFDGASDFVQGTNANLPQGNAARTMEAWVNPGTVTGGIISWGTGVSNVDRCALNLSSNRVYFYGHTNVLVGNIVIPSGTWAHVAVTFEGTTVKIYVNGVLDANSTAFTAINTAGTSFYVGCMAPGNLAGSAFIFFGIFIVFSSSIFPTCSPVMISGASSGQNFWIQGFSSGICIT